MQLIVKRGLVFFRVSIESALHTLRNDQLKGHQCYCIAVRNLKRRDGGVNSLTNLLRRPLLGNKTGPIIVRHMRYA